MSLTKFPNGVATDVDGVLYGEIVDISAGASSWTGALPFDAEVVGAYVTTAGATTVGPAVISFEIGGVAITTMEATIVVAGSGAGVSTAAVAPTALYDLDAGTAVEIITDGGSTDASAATVCISYKRV